MLRKVITAAVLIPLAAIFIVFAVANRHLVTVSFDPFNANAPAVGITLPLFVLLILTAILGVAAGGIATWWRQGRWRRAARRHEADARDARAQLASERSMHAPPLVPATRHLARPPV
jgi:uncharacterized integral membrane protein